MTFFEILMSLSVSLIQSPNKSGKWDTDKLSLYRTSRQAAPLLPDG